jgi:hypothetical protein
MRSCPICAAAATLLSHPCSLLSLYFLIDAGFVDAFGHAFGHVDCCVSPWKKQSALAGQKKGEKKVFICWAEAPVFVYPVIFLFAELTV